MEDIVVSDLYADTEQARITINQLPDDPGVAADVFAAVADGGVLVDMIVQNAAHNGIANISFTVPRDDVDRAILLLREVLERWPTTQVSCDRRIGKLSVVGIGLRSHTDVGARLFRTLAERNINVQMINTSEIKVSVVIKPDAVSESLAALRREFGFAEETRPNG